MVGEGTVGVGWLTKWTTSVRGALKASQARFSVLFESDSTSGRSETVSQAKSKSRGASFALTVIAATAAIDVEVSLETLT